MNDTRMLMNDTRMLMNGTRMLKNTIYEDSCPFVNIRVKE